PGRAGGRERPRVPLLRRPRDDPRPLGQNGPHVAPLPPARPARAVLKGESPQMQTDGRRWNYNADSACSLSLHLCPSASHLWRKTFSFESLESRRMLTVLPAGFAETTIASGLNAPSAMEFSPDGRLFVLEQTGNVELVHPDGTTFTALHLNVDSNGERGLLGI